MAMVRFSVETWPESQGLMERTDVYLINCEAGLTEFGSSAFFYPDPAGDYVEVGQPDDESYLGLSRNGTQAKYFKLAGSSE